MTDRPSLLERLKQARIVQVLIVYLGASWLVLQLVGTLKDLMTLPDWIGPITLILLGVGLLVVAATAWVQSLDSTTKAEEAGEVPTDWEVDTADVVASLKAGKLPHLTWGRAIMGGVVAISLAIGAAGAYVLVTGGGGLIGPTAAGAENSASAVAVLPFETQGADVEVYGEGMVSLLTANLEGLGGLRTINSGTIVARWHDEIGVTTSASLDEALRVAGGLNARYAVRGSVVDAGGQVRVSAEIFDVADGARLDGVRVEGAASAMLDLVDELTIGLANAFVGTRPGASRYGASRTSSLSALEAYLRGEALFRQQRFPAAIDEFRSAIAEDSTFALAWRGLSEAFGWVEPGAAEGVEAGRRAAALSGDLASRERLLMRVNADMTDGSRASVAELRAHLQRHPDDAEAWAALSEMAGHTPHLAMSPTTEFREALERSVELMPSFSPFYIHLAGLVLAEGTREEFDELVARMREVNPDDVLLDAWMPTWDFYHGDDDARREAIAFLDGASQTEMNGLSLVLLQNDLALRSLEATLRYLATLLVGTFPHMHTAIEISAGVPPEEWAYAERPEGAPGFVLWAILTGQADEGRRVLSSVAPGSHPAEAVSAAVLGAWMGDATLLDKGLAALPDTAWPSPFGQPGGAADPAQARSVVDAVEALRSGEPARAAEILDGILRVDRYDMLAVYLRGRASADLGEWQDAVRYWDVLIRSHFRTPVRLGLAQAYEALGDTTAALEGYRGFLTMWDHADPTLRPVVEARAAVARLGG